MSCAVFCPSECVLVYKGDGISLQFSDGGSPVNDLKKDNPGNDSLQGKNMAKHEVVPHFRERLYITACII